jgi:hypothetical protein
MSRPRGGAGARRPAITPPAEEVPMLYTATFRDVTDEDAPRRGD